MKYSFYGHFMGLRPNLSQMFVDDRIGNRALRYWGFAIEIPKARSQNKERRKADQQKLPSLTILQGRLELLPGNRLRTSRRQGSPYATLRLLKISFSNFLREFCSAKCFTIGLRLYSLVKKCLILGR